MGVMGSVFKCVAGSLGRMMANSSSPYAVCMQHTYCNTSAQTGHGSAHAYDRSTLFKAVPCKYFCHWSKQRYALICRHYGKCMRGGWGGRCGSSCPFYISKKFVFAALNLLEDELRI